MTNNPHAPSFPHRAPTIDAPTDEAGRVRGAARAPITNRMEDCGAGRHVGWWHEEGLGEGQSLLVSIERGAVTFACCEGRRAEKRIHFITGHAQAVEITRALMKALGIEEAALSNLPPTETDPR